MTNNTTAARSSTPLRHFLGRIDRRFARRANPNEDPLRLRRADLVPSPPAKHGRLQRLLGLQDYALGYLGRQTPDQIGQLLLQSQDQTLVSGIARIELQHLVQQSANGRLPRNIIILHVQGVQTVIVPQCGRERSRPFDSDFVIPESQGDQGGISPGQGSRQRRRSLGTDLILPQEELLDGFVEFEHVGDVTGALVGDLIGGEPDLGGDLVANERLAEVLDLGVVEILGLEPDPLEVGIGVG
mmetsp:Transcript_5871/g.12850  ORF Transcript_5871/g.12850 Transcript_5871/m.12850 type:complete len:242 (-) Transcript_5871:1398-2123(-)